MLSGDAVICSDHDVPRPTTSEAHYLAGLGAEPRPTTLKVHYLAGLVSGLRPTTNISRPRPLPARERLVCSDLAVLFSLYPDGASQPCAGRPGSHLMADVTPVAPICYSCRRPTSAKRHVATCRYLL